MDKIDWNCRFKCTEKAFEDEKYITVNPAVSWKGAVINLTEWTIEL